MQRKREARGRAGPARQGTAPDLARGVNGAGDGRSSKGEALLGEEFGGGSERRWAVGRRVAAPAWRRSFAVAGPVLVALPAAMEAAVAYRYATGVGGELGRPRWLRAAARGRGAAPTSRRREPAR
jgi:hypothetical protein